MNRGKSPSFEHNILEKIKLNNFALFCFLEDYEYIYNVYIYSFFFCQNIILSYFFKCFFFNNFRGM